MLLHDASLTGRTFSTEQAANQAGVHYVTLRRWLSAGKFKPSIQVEMADGRLLHRFTEADVRRLVKLVKEHRWDWPGQGRPRKGK